MDEVEGSRPPLIFLATYNEGSNIERLLGAIRGLPVICDVLVVDDNSPDGTADTVRGWGAINSRVRLIVRPKRLGIGSAHRLGWLYARRLGYTRLVTMDADLSHDPSDIPRLLEALTNGADVALGSRFVAGGQLDYRGWRRALSTAANWLSRKLTRLPLMEYTNSFRAVRLDHVPPGLIETTRNNGYGFFLTQTVYLARQGLGIVEVPTHFRDRTAGRSKMPRLQIILGAANLLRLTIFRGQFSGLDTTSATHSECQSCGSSYVITLRFGRKSCLVCMTEFDSEVVQKS